ncbi:hypothetical protein CsatA_028073 [Cannabis sativa]
MEIVVSIGAKISEYTVAPLGRQLGYLFYYARNVENLNTQLQHLNDAQNRLQRRLQDAQNNCQVIEADVTTWLTTFGQISREANTFLNHPDHAKVVCSCGSPPHLMMRHRLSRKARKMSIQVHDLKEECKFDTIAYPPHLHTLSTTTATATTTTLAATLAATTTSATTATTAAATTTLAATTATKGYESFNSRRVILEGIMAAVRDGNRKRIGLHGMGGIGKTMLAEEIAKVAKEEELFSKVVITTISQAPNVKEIQQHIAEMLEMTIFSQNESIVRRAELLRMRLERDESKILLILDDIWKELNLEEIGIHDGCKILVTSRYLHVLRNSMGMAESDVFFIGALKSSEAINLFMKIIGDTKVENNAYYNDLALKIVDECGGLPIAIATVAHALKCNMDSLFIWEDALQRLRTSNFTGIEGMHDKVYKSIRLSYDFLGSHEEEAKLLLLLCALHKEDEEIQVEDLIRYSMGWRLLQDIYTMEDARNRVNSLVVKLKSHCLLLDGTSTSNEVKMHDVIRDVCITIGKEDHGHRMMSNILMYEDERLKASKAISFLDYDHFDNLPPELECPSLELLLLSSGSTFESIPDEFFRQTGLLKVLIMNRTWIGSLPSSFASLQNLQTLCLRGSSLEDIAVIGELKNLKALDLSKSDFIMRLPKEIGALQRLQVLDLRGCRNLRVIKANVISNLTQMEELYLPREFEGWDKIIDEEVGIRNASLIEIKSMQRLTALHLYVPREHVLPEGLFSEKLERYQICIGVEYSSFSSKWLMRRSEYLSLVGLSLSQLEQAARELISLMRRSECLSLTGSMSVNSVSPSLVNEGFPRLKHLRFSNNDGVQCINNSTDVAFPCLESITLVHLRSLESICRGNKLPRGSFNQLRKVDVRCCGRLKNLFPLSVAKLLDEIIVQECEMIEEIVVREDGDEVGHNIDDYHSSLQLRSLQLYILPKLVQFYCSNHRAAEESDHSKPLFSETVSFPNLEDLTMKKMDIEMLWPEQLLLSSSSSSFYMQNLTTLKVGSCHNLKYLFSSSVAQKFVNLKSIQVRDCNAMKDIIRVVDQPGEKESTYHDQIDRIDLLSKLEFVQLVGLSSLQRFCSATDLSPCVVFPLLSKLDIKYCSTMNKAQARAVSTQGPFFNKKTSFPNLKELIVTYCNNLKSLLSSAMARNLVQLERLSVNECEKMEAVIVSDHDEEYISSSGGSNINAIIPFQKFDSLELNDLPNLIRFCELGDYCIECPLLSQLIIEGCPKLKELFMGDKRTSSSSIITTTNNNIIGEKKDRMMSAPNKQSLFKHNNKVIFPMIKVLRSDWSEVIKEIFEMSSNSIVLFPNLDTLHLTCTSPDEVIGVPNLKLFLHKYHTIHKLTLSGCFVNLSSSGDSEVTNNTTTTHLTSTSAPSSFSSSLEQLYIDGADDMVDHVFGVEPSSHNNTIILLFPNLRRVDVWGCSRLQSFAPSFMFFHNLEALIVSGCHGLRYLLSSSTATTLVRLQRMEISYCNEIKEIIINHNSNEEEEEEKDSLIVFQNLKQLELQNLPSLQSFFYSGNKVTMSIPNLEQLSIWRCPEMRRFSNGIVDPSASLSIEVDGKRIHVERDDVNATLVKLFREDNNKNNNSDLGLRQQ